MGEDSKQLPLFDITDEYALWWKEWQGMPEFIQDDLGPVQSVVVHFATLQDVADFAKLIEQKITRRTRSVWFPRAEIGTYADKRYTDES
jgi:hypothetical protein